MKINLHEVREDEDEDYLHEPQVREDATLFINNVCPTQRRFWRRCLRELLSGALP